MPYTYTVYNFILQTPFPCPVLLPAPPNAAPDVVVRDGAVPRQLDAPVIAGEQWQAEPGRFLWRGGARSGRFLVENGHSVTVQRNPAAENELLAFHLLDTVLAAVLRRRGLLVLHANAAVTPTGEAIAVSGQSGAGKSTTLATLLARGCTMLTDDITALRPGTAGGVEALPGIPQLHLCEDAAEGLGQNIAHLPRYQWRRLKAAVPAAVSPVAAPLRALYLLQTGPGDGVRVQLLTGAEKFSAIQSCVFGPMLSQEHPQLFQLFAAVAGQVAVYRLERPAGQWTVDAIANRIINPQT